METSSAIIILTPVFLPLVRALGISTLHFGILFVVGIAIGMIAPPVAINLFRRFGHYGAVAGKDIQGRRSLPHRPDRRLPRDCVSAALHPRFHRLIFSGLSYFSTLSILPFGGRIAFVQIVWGDSSLCGEESFLFAVPRGAFFSYFLQFSKLLLTFSESVL